MPVYVEDVGDGFDKNAVVQTEDVAYSKMASRNPDATDMISKARAATRKEHHMSLWKSLKLYPTAAFFSFVISGCIIMEGALTFPPVALALRLLTQLIQASS